MGNVSIYAGTNKWKGRVSEEALTEARSLKISKGYSTNHFYSVKINPGSHALVQTGVLPKVLEIMTLPISYPVKSIYRTIYPIPTAKLLLQELKEKGAPNEIINAEEIRIAEKWTFVNPINQLPNTWKNLTLFSLGLGAIFFAEYAFSQLTANHDYCRTLELGLGSSREFKECTLANIANEKLSDHQVIKSFTILGVSSLGLFTLWSNPDSPEHFSVPFQLGFNTGMLFSWGPFAIFSSYLSFSLFPFFGNFLPVKARALSTTKHASFKEAANFAKDSFVEYGKVFIPTFTIAAISKYVLGYERFW